jgi:hypothetical protein
VDDQDAAAYARAPEPEDVTRICRALNDAGAHCVLIGGFAVVAHRASRFTKAIDLPVDEAPEHIARVKQGLSMLTKDTYRPQDAIDRSFLHQLLERRRRE